MGASNLLGQGQADPAAGRLGRVKRDEQVLRIGNAQSLIVNDDLHIASGQRPTDVDSWLPLANDASAALARRLISICSN